MQEGPSYGTRRSGRRARSSFPLDPLLAAGADLGLGVTGERDGARTCLHATSPQRPREGPQRSVWHPQDALFCRSAPSKDKNTSWGEVLRQAVRRPGAGKGWEVPAVRCHCWRRKKASPARQGGGAASVGSLGAAGSCRAGLWLCSPAKTAGSSATQLVRAFFSFISNLISRGHVRNTALGSALPRAWGKKVTHQLCCSLVN